MFLILTDVSEMYIVDVYNKVYNLTATGLYGYHTTTIPSPSGQNLVSDIFDQIDFFA